MNARRPVLNNEPKRNSSLGLGSNRPRRRAGFVAQSWPIDSACASAGARSYSTPSRVFSQLSHRELSAPSKTRFHSHKNEKTVIHRRLGDHGLRGGSHDVYIRSL